MESIKRENGDLVIKTSIEDVTEANLLRWSFLTCIPGLAVEYVSFNHNDTPRFDELLAHRLGLMPIRYDSELNGRTYTFSFEGWTRNGIHRRITCSDMDGIPFVYQDSTLTHLREGERLSFTATLGIGVASTHAKFSAVSRVGFRESDDGTFVFTLKSIGTHEDEDLVRFALEGMELAALSTNPSPFFKLRLPDKYK